MRYYSDKITALYYRRAHKGIEQQHLDNQMKKLLCYAAQKDMSSYALYVDDGANGITLERPAFMELTRALTNGRIDEIVVTDFSRIARNIVNAVEFLQCAKEHGAAITVLDGGIELLEVMSLIPVYAKERESK